MLNITWFVRSYVAETQGMHHLLWDGKWYSNAIQLAYQLGYSTYDNEHEFNHWDPFGFFLSFRSN